MNLVEIILNVVDNHQVQFIYLLGCPVCRSKNALD